jgi:hypothetical protein
MVNPEYTVHLRPLFVAGHDEISARRVVSIKGQFTDVFNTIDTSGPVSEPFRTQAVFDGYEEGVVANMGNVQYGKLNRAHQLTQGRAGGSSPPCALIGKGCQETTAPTSLAYTMEGAHAYMCAACKENWRDFRRRSDGKQEWTSPVQGFLKLTEERKHTSYKLPLGDRDCECCGSEEIKSRVFLNLTSHVVCMPCYRWFTKADTIQDWREQVDEATILPRCKIL